MILCREMLQFAHKVSNFKALLSFSFASDLTILSYKSTYLWRNITLNVTLNILFDII